MRYLVTSDLHLGNQFCQSQLFQEMVQRLDDSVILVLAGDIIDAPGKPLSAQHQHTLTEILKRASRNQVIWIEGNHDEGYRPTASSDIEFRRAYAIGNRALITHGDRFDNVMPRNLGFITLFKLFHKLRIYCGAHPIHVADYAKRFEYLYGFLRRKVMLCAINHARQYNFSSVVCGHVHFAEDTYQEEIRYINLGAWTESICYCLLIDNQDMHLLSVKAAMKNQEWFYQK